MWLGITGVIEQVGKLGAGFTSFQTKAPALKTFQRQLCWTFSTEESVQGVEAAMVLDPAKPLRFQHIWGPPKALRGAEPRKPTEAKKA